MGKNKYYLRDNYNALVKEFPPRLCGKCGYEDTLHGGESGTCWLKATNGFVIKHYMPWALMECGHG